ncbi:unnamed protein product [Blepharisma stoltei]|uniref:Uncharacterized protein n=1 Tax=Blepharisma stoltei TaxID=1481888 RepID=A0AAU9IZH6_9CILI|nr:unnamed protein product [Blepharisma stoltei]
MGTKCSCNTDQAEYEFNLEDESANSIINLNRTLNGESRTEELFIVSNSNFHSSDFTYSICSKYSKLLGNNKR